MKREIYSIPGRMVGHYDPEINGIIDTWSSLLVTLDQFRENIFDIGVLDFAPRHGVNTWIVDNSTAEGVYRKDVQSFIQTTVAPKCAEIGIRYFFVVLPQGAIAKLSARNVAKINANQEGMQTLEVASVQEAIDLLQEAQVL